MSERLQYAKWFIDHGFAIFPIDPSSKKPVIAEWQKYSHEPLTEEEKQKFLSMVEQGYNYAVPCGQQNLVVLDFEDKELVKSWLGESELEKLCKRTLCVLTPHGGLHVFLQADEIPEHKFNPAFVKDNKTVMDLQSYNSYVVGVGSCINHKGCNSEKCQWRGQDYETCYTLYNELREIGKVDLKGLLKFLADKGKKLGIELSPNARAWVEGKKEDPGINEDLEKLKREMLKYNKFKGKTLDAIKEEVCKSIKSKLENARSNKAKAILNTAWSVVCEGKKYEDIGIDRSRGDWRVLKVLLAHGVTDLDVLQQLLPADSKVFAPKWDKYFIYTLTKAWKETRPWLKLDNEAKTMEKDEVKDQVKKIISEIVLRTVKIATFVRVNPYRDSIIGIYRWNKKHGVYEPYENRLRKLIRELIEFYKDFNKKDGKKGILYVKVSKRDIDDIIDEIKDKTLRLLPDEPLRVAFKNATIEWTNNTVELIEDRDESKFAFHYIPHKLKLDELKQLSQQVKGREITIADIENLAQAVCPKSLKVFKEWVDEKWVLLFEIIGYTLYPDIKYRKAFMLLGSGANGKTTFLNLIKKALGSENVASVRLKELLDPNNRFSTAVLFHKLANLTSEVKEYSIEDADKFKILTGGDYITADVKFKDPIYFKPYAKLIVASNKLPSVRDKDDPAFWSRWIIVEFPHKFTDKGPSWFEETFTEDEIEGILTTAIVAFSRVLQQDRFDYQQTEEELKGMWLKNIDSVYAFIDDYVKKGILTIDPKNGDLWTPRKQLYQLYKNYCIDQGFKGVSAKTFSRRLREYFGITISQKGPNKERAFVGIAINPVDMLNEMAKHEVKPDEVLDFIEYVKNHNGEVIDFADIVRDFNGDKEKANKFTVWCETKRLCYKVSWNEFRISIN